MSHTDVRRSKRKRTIVDHNAKEKALAHALQQAEAEEDEYDDGYPPVSPHEQRIACTTCSNMVAISHHERHQALHVLEKDAMYFKQLQVS